MFVDKQGRDDASIFGNEQQGTEMLPIPGEKGLTVRSTTDYGPHKAGKTLANVRYSDYPEVGLYPIDIADLSLIHISEPTRPY